MEYHFILPDFEGPLDLLLHLIKQNNINIFDIDIVNITNQYLDYITNMKEMNLDIASEYIVMAAELIEMKARELLPIESFDENEDMEDNPREQLINRLLEYQVYKDSSENLEYLEKIRNEVYTKDPSDLNEFKDEIIPNYDLTLEDLINAITEFYQNQELHKPLNTKITLKEYSIEQRSNEIKDILKNEQQVSFTKLLDNKTKQYLVVTFLAILNLSKHKEILLKQDANFKDIIITTKEFNK